MPEREREPVMAWLCGLWSNLTSRTSVQLFTLISCVMAYSRSSSTVPHIQAFPTMYRIPVSQGGALVLSMTFFNMKLFM